MGVVTRNVEHAHGKNMKKHLLHPGTRRCVVFDFWCHLTGTRITEKKLARLVLHGNPTKPPKKIPPRIMTVQKGISSIINNEPQLSLNKLLCVGEVAPGQIAANSQVGRIRMSCGRWGAITWQNFC